MAQHGRGRTHDKIAAEIFRIGVNLRLVENSHAFPRQVRVGHENGTAFRRTRRRNGKGIRAKGRRILLPVHFILQHAQRPLEQHGASDGRALPAVEFHGAVQSLFGMLRDIGLHPPHEVVAKLPDVFRCGLPVPLANLRVLEYAQVIVLFGKLLAESRGHRAHRRAHIPVNIFEPVLGLGIPQGIRRIGPGIGVHVRHTPGVAIQGYFFRRGRGRSRQ